MNSLSSKALLVVIDGLGINENSHKNALHAATTPNLDQLFKHYPTTTLTSGGPAVGLPEGISGNSEVGHLNLGAGRPVRQDLVRINEAIAQGNLAELPKLRELIEYALANGGRLHLMGLLSDGGVHSHIDHLKELLRIFSAWPKLQIYLHAFIDGRDTAPTAGLGYLKEIMDEGACKISSIQGRYWAMDRDCRWEKIELAYQTMIGLRQLSDQNPLEYLQSQYNQKMTDEFITPILFEQEAAIGQGDALFFINFRPDRAKQISLAFCDPRFAHFVVDVRPGHFLCMTPYIDEEVKLPILFDKKKLTDTLCGYLSSQGLRQFKIAETEKYAHVTYFFNGGETRPFTGEDQVLIPSPRDVATYDLKPQMSANEVTARLLSVLDEDYQFYCVNYANCDMVGHTGNYLAAIKAVEAVDQCVGQLMKKCLEDGTALLLTADHGNCDQMAYQDGTPHTSHTDAPVPFTLCHPQLKDAPLQPTHNDLALRDVAPTILHCLGIETPEAFTGKPIFASPKKEIVE